MSATRLSAYAALFIAVVIWGIAGPVIKVTLDHLPADIFLLYRFAISSVFALAVWASTSEFRQFIHSKHKGIILLYGLLVAPITLWILFLGYEKTSTLVAAFLSALAPIMTAIAGTVVFHDRITKREKIGITIACIGAIIAAIGPVDNTASSIWGNMLIVLSLIVGIAAGILAKKTLKEHTGPLLLTNMSFVVGFLVMLPLALASHPWQTVVESVAKAPLGAHLGVWYMALLSGTLAYYLWNRGQKSVELSEAGLFNYLIPVVTVPISFFFLHESVSTLFLVGTVITAIGVCIAEIKKRSSRATKIQVQRKSETRPRRPGRARR